MKRLHAWITGAAGGVAAYRLFRRNRDTAAEPVAEPSAGADPRAEELRAKLAATRADEDSEPVAAEPAAEESPEERRRRVHEQARGALDEMQEG